jgi:membrane-associated phospholipid phosphatase
VQTIAAFASLHVGITVTACLVAHWAGLAARIRWLLWGFLALTVLSTVYLGWHYLFDAVGGVVLGAAAAMLGAVVTGNADVLRGVGGEQVSEPAPPVAAESR